MNENEEYIEYACRFRNGIHTETRTIKRFGSGTFFDYLELMKEYYAIKETQPWATKPSLEIEQLRKILYGDAKETFEIGLHLPLDDVKNRRIKQQRKLQNGLCALKKAYVPENPRKELIDLLSKVKWSDFKNTEVYFNTMVTFQMWIEELKDEEFEDSLADETQFLFAFRGLPTIWKKEINKMEMKKKSISALHKIVLALPACQQENRVLSDQDSIHNDLSSLVSDGQWHC